MTHFSEKGGDALYVAFRVLIGIGFLLHGISKVGGVQLMSLLGLAMIIELVAGVFVILGLFTRTVAVIAALEMAYAFFFVHVVGQGTLNPLSNGGEPAMLYFAAFLVLSAFGARRWSLDTAMKKRR